MGRGGLWVWLQICAEGYASQIWENILDNLALKSIFLFWDSLEMTAAAVIPTAGIVVSLLCARHCVKTLQASLNPQCMCVRLALSLFPHHR